MLTVTASQLELIRRIVRRVDRKLAFEAHHLPDGSIEVKLAQGTFKAQTRLAATALEAAAADATQFEMIRQQVKRVCDRMRAPAPPPRVPKVEIQRDLAFSFRSGGQRGRSGRR